MRRLLAENDLKVAGFIHTGPRGTGFSASTGAGGEAWYPAPSIEGGEGDGTEALPIPGGRGGWSR